MGFAFPPFDDNPLIVSCVDCREEGWLSNITGADPELLAEAEALIESVRPCSRCPAV
jgi:hypothetical protein